MLIGCARPLTGCVVLIVPLAQLLLTMRMPRALQFPRDLQLNRGEVLSHDPPHALGFNSWWLN